MHGQHVQLQWDAQKQNVNKNSDWLIHKMNDSQSVMKLKMMILQRASFGRAEIYLTCSASDTRTLWQMHCMYSTFYLHLHHLASCCVFTDETIEMHLPWIRPCPRECTSPLFHFHPSPFRRQEELTVSFPGKENL